MSQFRVFQDKTSLITQAAEEAKKADKDFETSVKYYFIARNFVAIYESRFSALPIQVWNEYRNALDHFFRHQTNVDRPNSKHLKKMEDHLLRACLDVLKLFCHEMMKHLENKFQSYDRAVLVLVEDGSFISSFEKGKKNARMLFEQAKIGDVTMGNDTNGDMVALNAYLESAFAFDNLDAEWNAKTDKINNALLQHSNIGNSASKHSTVHHLLVHCLFYIIKAVVVGGAVWLGFYFNEEISEFTNWVTSLFG